jgi:hypothetical protein
MRSADGVVFTVQSHERRVGDHVGPVDPDVRLVAPFSAKTLCLLVNMNSLSPAGAATAAGGDSRQSHALACGQGVPLCHRVLPLRRVCAAK